MYREKVGSQWDGFMLLQGLKREKMGVAAEVWDNIGCSGIYPNKNTSSRYKEITGKMVNSNKKNELRYKGIEFYQTGGWQRSDQEHPSGTGKLGYRVVYKTLKLIPFPAVNLSWPNLKVRIVVEKVEYGGLNVKGNAIPSILPNRLLLPEYLEVISNDNSISYQGKINMKWEFEAYTEEFPMSGIVEMLLEVDRSNEDDIISTGRRNLSPILTILDFVYGERLIGSLITEEVVELFPDGHWNRKIISPSVGSESQLHMKKTEDSQFKQMKKSIEAYNGLRESVRKNVALATDWFWKSERESDRVDRFIQLWICLEALEMLTTDIKPISQQLEIISTENYDFWKIPVGRLFGKRSNLVHGNSVEVEEHEIIILRGIAKTLLANRLGKIENPELVQELISLIKIHFR